MHKKKKKKKESCNQEEDLERGAKLQKKHSGQEWRGEGEAND